MKKPYFIKINKLNIGYVVEHDRGEFSSDVQKESHQTLDTVLKRAQQLLDPIIR
jgi:hypothetical protein